MTVGLKMGSVVTEIGTGSFLHSFFSTVTCHLEPMGWGTRYSSVMNKLYNGTLEQADAQSALDELKEIKNRLREFRPNQVVWDIEDLAAKPPWGDRISSSITDLSKYFVTSGGKDLFRVLVENIEYLEKHGGVLQIIQYQGYPVGEQLKWETVTDKRDK